MDDICQLENGTPIVACYNDREYQFDIYGKRHVIYQDLISRTTVIRSLTILQNVLSVPLRPNVRTLCTSAATRGLRLLPYTIA